MIKYGKGLCEITGAYQEVIIKYRGQLVLRHPHLEFVEDIGNNHARVRNWGSKSMLIRNHNQIHIGFVDQQIQDGVLFRYVGNFKILSAKIDGINATIELLGVDYWNLIKSKWDNLGKPEQYRGTYKHGKSSHKQPREGIKQSSKIKKQIKKQIKTRKTTKITKGGY